MQESEGVEPILYRIKERVERRDELGGNPLTTEEKLMRMIKDPGKIPTTEEAASKEEVEKIANKTSMVRGWLKKNGKVASQEFPEEFKDRYIFGVPGKDIEDLRHIRWAMRGILDKDFILVSSDFDPDLEGHDIQLEAGTSKYSVMVRLASDREFDLTVGFYNWSFESYMVDSKPFEDIDQDQGKIINHYLDEAIRRFEIPPEM